mmetsp:Transcript_29157/g.78894  ORF Transcript_29157/g.78894 Transcript_29157/m.78894 type:complete len:204 (+) Transcript_29157:795-1406(+)
MRHRHHVLFARFCSTPAGALHWPRSGSSVDRLGGGLCENQSLFHAYLVAARSCPSGSLGRKRLCHTVDCYSVFDRRQRVWRPLPGACRRDGTSRSGHRHPSRSVGRNLCTPRTGLQAVGPRPFPGIVEEKETNDGKRKRKQPGHVQSFFGLCRSRAHLDSGKIGCLWLHDTLGGSGPRAAHSVGRAPNHPVSLLLCEPLHGSH